MPVDVRNVHISGQYGLFTSITSKPWDVKDTSTSLMSILVGRCGRPSRIRTSLGTSPGRLVRTSSGQSQDETRTSSRRLSSHWDIHLQRQSSIISPCKRTLHLMVTRIGKNCTILYCNSYMRVITFGVLLQFELFKFSVQRKYLQN